jgi:co-chaperonin GroES (HSP10)
MAGTGAGKWSTTAANNTNVQTTNWAEGMAPSDVNNAARESLSHIRSALNGVAEGFVEYGDGDATYTVTKIDADSFTITSSSDLRSVYSVGRNIRVTHNSGVTSGQITSNAYSSPTLTVNCGGGVNITGSTITKVELGFVVVVGGGVGSDHNDNVKVRFGTGDDLEIYHDGSNSNISDVGTGKLVLRSDGTGVDINKGSSENIAKFIADGAVELYHDNSKKFETTSAGVSVSGTVTSTGATVNGVLGGSWYTLSQSSPSGGNNGDFWFKY